MNNADLTAHVLDPVTLLIAELCATAKPRDPGAFVHLLARLTEEVLREAFEHQDEIRERLGMARPRVNDADQRACPYCGDEVASMIGHACARMRELGLDIPAGSESPTRPAPLLDGLSPQGQPEPGAARAPSVLSEKSRDSTGAAEAQTKAAQPSHVAPAAPSIDTPPRAGQSPGVALPSAASVATTNRDKDAPGPSSPALAEPAPSTKPPQPSLSDSAADGAGTSPAGPRAGAEASQLTPTKHRVVTAQPIARKVTDELRERIQRDYRVAAEANNGRAPRGWISREAEALGLKYQAVYDVVKLEKGRRFSLRTIATNGAPTRGMREHTRNADCWCRRLPANQWCTAETLPAALRTPRPRAERYGVRR